MALGDGRPALMLDALASERHFVDHLAAVWSEIPSALRGAFYATPSVIDHARALGLDPVPVPVLAGGTAGRGVPLLVAAYGDIRRGRFYGWSRFAFLEHGAGQSYAGDTATERHHSYAGGGQRDDVALFLVPNEQAAARWRAAYPDARVDVVGSPVLDRLPAREPGPGPVVAISFHWDLPARSTGTAPEMGSAMREYSVFVIRHLARRFALLGHGHPRREDMAAYFEAAGVEYVPDFRDVCRRADVYAVDNSSTLFEFAATGRPVVVLNSRRYRRDVDHGLRFEPSAGCSIESGVHFCGAAHVGVQADTPAALPAALELAIGDPADVAAARDAALELVYQPRSGGARLAGEALARFAGD